jgi:hypothetical protein
MLITYLDVPRNHQRIDRMRKYSLVMLDKTLPDCIPHEGLEV